MPALTGLRFVLAIWVILHHLTGTGRLLDPLVRTLPEPLQSVLASGYVAVGTFFVLSGFVLARSYSSVPWNRSSLIHYGIARCARAYPVYLLSVLVVLPFIFADLVSPGRLDLPQGQKAALVAHYGLVLQGWTAKLPVHWNTPAWSLSCELFFYLCFPLLVAALRGVRWWQTAAAALAIPLAVRAAGVPADWKPVIHLSDFLLGIAVAGAFARTPRLAGRGYLFYAPALAAALVLVCAPKAAGDGLQHALRAVNALLIFGMALGGGIPAHGLSTRTAVALGKASYSMYILHIPLLWWHKRGWLHLSGAVSQTESALLYVAGVVAVSAGVYRWFEEPANRWIREWARARFPIPREAR